MSLKHEEQRGRVDGDAATLCSGFGDVYEKAVLGTVAAHSRMSPKPLDVVNLAFRHAGPFVDRSGAVDPTGS
jgi:hypothetical protein